MMHAQLLGSALVALAISAAGLQANINTSASPTVDATVTHLFDEFISKHGRQYKSGTQEYQDRRDLFEHRLGLVQQHNMKVGRLWKAGINKLADMTDAELSKLRGYKRSVRSGPPSSSGAAPAAAMGLLAGTGSESGFLRMPPSFSWAGKLNATTKILDQGRCGSCWAFASVTALNAHSELFAEGHTFSPQQIVSCAPNPRKCGGDGGCEGSTVELAFDYLLQTTAVSEDDFPYEAKTLECPLKLRVNEARPQVGVHGAEAPAVEDVSLALRSGLPSKAYGLTGWMALPENKARPFFQTLYETGPIAVALAAYARWNYYESGILDSCGDDEEANQAFVVNHAVVLIGWGEEHGHSYWQIQNSWGPDWGESGYMRILRKQGMSTEEQLCAIDDDPLIGVGCPGGPSSVTVCGSCGMLYDGLVPTFEGSLQSWWSKHGHQAFTMGGQSLLRGPA